MSAPTTPTNFALGCAFRDGTSKNAALYFKWDAQVGATMQIERSVAPLAKKNPKWEIAGTSLSGAASTAVAGGLLGADYVYRIRGINGDGASAYAANLVVLNPKLATKAAPPAPPTGLRLVSTNSRTGIAVVRFELNSTGADSVVFRWSVPGSGAGAGIAVILLNQPVAGDPQTGHVALPAAPPTFEASLPLNNFGLNVLLQPQTRVTATAPIDGNFGDPLTIAMPAAAVGFIASPPAGSGYLGGAIQTVTLTSNKPAATWAASGLPSGVSLTDLGGGIATLSGTPAAAGVFTVVITVSAPGDTDYVANVIITVTALTMVISSSLNVAGRIATAFSYTIVAALASGAGAANTYSADNMPAWMSRTGAVLSGTPPAPGVFTVNISAWQSASPSTTTGTATLTVTVPAITITSAATVAVAPGVLTSFALTASVAGVSWALVDGPAWAFITGSSLRLAATAAGVFEVTVSASINGNTTEQTIEVTSAATVAPVVDPTQNVLGFALYQAFSFQPAASNFPSLWTAVGLPDGVTMDAETGLIAGAIGVVGTYNVAVRAANSIGVSPAVVFTIGVDAGGVQQLDDGSLVEVIVDTVDRTVRPPVRNEEVSAGTVITTTTSTDPAAQKAIDERDKLIAKLKEELEKFTTPVFFVKFGDTVLLGVRFFKDIVPLDLEVTSLRFVMKAVESEAVLVEATDYELVGDGFASYYRLPVEFTGAALAAALSDEESSAAITAPFLERLTRFSGLCEIEWGFNVTHNGVSTACLASSRTFPGEVQRDLAPTA